jgi:hypothetical protein
MTTTIGRRRPIDAVRRAGELTHAIERRNVTEQSLCGQLRETVRIDVVDDDIAAFGIGLGVVMTTSSSADRRAGAVARALRRHATLHVQIVIERHEHVDVARHR